MSEVISVFVFTGLQASLSAAVSLLGGFTGALGLVTLPKGSFRRGIEILLLIPGLVPVLLMILSYLKVFALGGRIPFGLPGIVILHAVLNVGLTSVALAHLMESRLGGVAQGSHVMGARHWLFWRSAIRLLRWDLLIVGFYVFAVCFTSFAIPLVMSGGKGTTIELLIYELIRLDENWVAATWVCLIQVLFIFLMGWGLSRSSPSASSAGSLKRYGVQGAWLLPSIFTVLLFFGWLPYPLIWPPVSLWPLFFQSLIVGWAVSLMVLVGLWGMGWLIQVKRFQRLMLGVSLPSVAVTGFVLLHLGTDTTFWSFARIVIGVSLISLPVLFRLRGYSLFSSLAHQWRIARSLGAGPFLAFREILVKQTIKPVCELAALAGVWAVGDFAISIIVSTKEVTLGMLVHSLMSSYRLPMAVSVTWLLIACGLIVLITVGGFGRVFGPRLET